MIKMIIRNISKKPLLVAATICFLAIGIQTCANTDTVTNSSDQKRPPNIVVIVADDMGYSDIGVLGSEIKTPNIDRLAKEGTLFTRFYTSPTCSPTRAMLLSGVDNHLAGLGNMAETIDPAQIGQPGYEGVLNRDVANMAEIFNAANYQTYMTGKWHLGLEHDESPYAHGFQKTFALLGGGASHFNDFIGQDVYRTVAYYRENGELVKELPDDFFSSNYFTDKLISFIKGGDRDRPFLGYLAFTAPHWPLQAPKEDILAQRGNYASGYDVIRKRRFDALKKAGVIPQDAVQPTGNAPAWETLSEEERTRSERVMEVYAAMVENMDDNIGQLMNELEAMGELDNTIILFMSDNGADGLEFSAIGAAFADWTNSFNNSLENIGQKNSFVAYGRGWAHTGEASHLGFKGQMTEGGIRSPLVFFAPMAPDRNQNPQMVNYSHTATVRDILPTLLDFAGIANHNGQFDGRTVYPISGKSLRDIIAQPNTAVHEGQAIAKELWNRRSVMMDNWKLVRNAAPGSDDEWKLYNLDEDLGESNDLSAQYPELVQQLTAEYESYAKENNVIAPTAPFRLVEPKNPTIEK